MRLRLALDVSFGFGNSAQATEGFMSDWIKDMKDRDDKAALAVRQEQEFRLHRAAVIKGKAPVFWKSLVDAAASDCKALNAAYADDIRKQCSFSAQGEDRITLTGNTEERVILVLHLSLDSLEISQTQHSGHDRTPQRSALRFEISKDEQLFLTGLGGNTASPEGCAEKLIKRVIGQ